MKEGNKAVVISIDAMTGTDYDELSKREAFSSLISHSSLVENIHTLWPSYTYPCHAAIITGCYPGKSGIFHNEKLDITRKKNEWFWWEKDIKRKTIIEYAGEAGLTTAAIGWPVTAGGKADYTIPEIWPLEDTPDAEGMYRRAVSEKAWPVFMHNRECLVERKGHYYDIYTTGSAEEIIEKYNPDLILIHLSALDSVKHTSGSDPSVLRNAYDYVDSCLSRIVKASVDAGTYPDTTFFLLGDHGQMDIKRSFALNRVLAGKGFITLENDRIESWRILSHPSSFSAEIYLDGISEKEAISVLEEIREEYPGTIERIYSAFEAEEIYHLSGPFGIVVESTPGTYLPFSPFLPVLKDRTDGPYSSHGYAPEKGPKPVFAVCGKAAAEGVRIPWARLVDEGPTILSLFGITMDGDIDGRVIEGLLR